MDCIAVITTVARREDALAMARAIVGQRLAACAQLSAIESVYTWDGAVQHEPEVRLVFKTTAAAWPAIEAAIRAHHPYELPAIAAVSFDAVHAPFADWIGASVAAP